MKNLFRSEMFFALFMIICVNGFPSQAQAAPKGKAKPLQVQKERLVLMPLRLGEADQQLQGAMETALVEGLQRQYEVLSGDQVAKKAREIFQKESRNTAKKECDETRCLQGITEAFNSELLAIASVTKQDGGYFLALSIRNLYDNIDVYSKSLPCRGCDSFQAVDKIKELIGSPVSVPVVAEPEAPKITATDPDSITWAEAQKGNTVDDYQVYLDAYPKGKYIAFAKAKLKKLKEAAQAVAEQQEQQLWDSVQQENSEAGYLRYLTIYPTGRFVGFARARQTKLKADLAYKAETELWQKAEAGMDKAAVEAYLSLYPTGRYVAQASAKLAEIKAEAGKGPAMVKIPGHNAEIGKYLVTRGEFAKFVQETGYDSGNVCWSWTGQWEKRDASWRNPGYSQDDTHPVTCVSWDDANAYVQWFSKTSGRNYRLPNETEWEAACYAGNKTEYCGSNDIDAVAWYNGNSNKTTHPVGQKQANGYGLYDMSGNVWEWMENWYDDTKRWRVVRGGAWSYAPQNMHAATRRNDEQTGRNDFSGFRLARTLP